MYKRIYIFGGTGSGKTTLAKKLTKLTSIPFHTTDDFVYKKKWNEKYTEQEKETNLKNIARKNKWIIEGVHGEDWLLPAIKRAELIILLDVPKPILYKRVIQRYLKKEKPHYKNIAAPFKMLYWSHIYKKDAYLQHTTHIKNHPKNAIILKTNKEINEFLKNFNTTS